MATARSRPRSSGRRGPRLSLLLLGLALFVSAGILYYSYDIEDFRTNLVSGGFVGAGPTEDVSFVIAARDTEYCGYHTACGPGMRTDTIFYMRLRGSEVTAVALPRDLHYTDTPCEQILSTDTTCEPTYDGKINSVYERSGAEGLRHAVEKVLGVPVQHYAILTFDSVMKLVNAVDGVDVVLPEPMKYTDRAAGLFIDFPAGPRHLDGKDAVKYMRFRRWEGSDLGRLDRIKGVLDQVARKAQNPLYWPRLPVVANQVWNSLETTLPLPTALKLLPYLRGINIKSATIPTLEDGNDLKVDPEGMTSFTSSLLGYIPDGNGLERIATAQPNLKTLILDQSGKNLSERYRIGLGELGLSVPEIQIEDKADVPSTVYVRSGLSVVGRESPAFALARDYADVLHLPLQTKNRLRPEGYDVVIVLGP